MFPCNEDLHTSYSYEIKIKLCLINYSDGSSRHSIKILSHFWILFCYDENDIFMLPDLDL